MTEKEKVYCYTCKFLVDVQKGICVGSKPVLEDSWYAPKGTPFSTKEYACDKNSNNDCPDYHKM